MSKTPFEIRLELLQIATRLLQEEHNLKRDAALTLWQEKLTQARDRNDFDVPEFPELPAFPTNAEIIAKAKELNEFISYNG